MHEKMHLSKRYSHIHASDESDKKGFICLFFSIQNSFQTIKGLWSPFYASDIAKLVHVVHVLVLCPG